MFQNFTKLQVIIKRKRGSMCLNARYWVWILTPLGHRDIKPYSDNKWFHLNPDNQEKNAENFCTNGFITFSKCQKIFVYYFLQLMVLFFQARLLKSIASAEFPSPAGKRCDSNTWRPVETSTPTTSPRPSLTHKKSQPSGNKVFVV